MTNLTLLNTCQEHGVGDYQNGHWFCPVCGKPVGEYVYDSDHAQTVVAGKSWLFAWIHAAKREEALKDKVNRRNRQIKNLRRQIKQIKELMDLSSIQENLQSSE